MDKFYMTGFTKFNHTHDAKGKFSTGDAGTISTARENMSMSAAYAQRGAEMRATRESGSKNAEVAARIKDSVYTTSTGDEVALTSSSHWRGGVRVEAKDDGGKVVGSMIATPFDSQDHYTVSMIQVNKDNQRQGIGTAMIEYGRQNSDLPIEHSVNLTDDGVKFVATVKSFYQTGVAKDVGGDIHVDSLLGSRTEKPKKKKPKHDGEMRVEKFNHTHDGLGRFGTGSGGSSDAPGWTTEQTPTGEWASNGDLVLAASRRGAKRDDLDATASSTRAALVKAGVPVVPVKMVGKPIGDHAMVAYYQLDNPGVITMNQTSMLGTNSFFGVHEYGHLLDVEHFKSRSRLATSDPKSPVAGVVAKINVTAAAEGWKQSDNAAYWAKPSEMFARAFAQYVATKSGDPSMLKMMKSQASAQWSETEFAPISAEFDNVFAAPVVKAFYMTGVRKYNKNHDEKGRFGAGAGGTIHDSYAGLHQAPTAAGENPPLTRVTDIYPSDVISSNGVRFYGMGSKRYEPDEHKAVGIMREAKAAADAGKPIPKVKVYRAIPASVKSSKINRGDWVTPSKIYAQDHAAGNLGEGVKGKIISAEVPADHLYTDANSLLEWGYDPPVKKSIEPFYMVGFEKFNHNHDGLGRFTDNVGGGAHGIGVETPAMHAQNAERWANTVAARQHKDALRALEHSAAVHVAADSIHSQAIQNEPAITSQMKELAGAHGAQLVGLEFRIKAPGSLGRKISADAKVENISPADAAANISDSVRYTMKLPARKYTSGARKTIGELQAKGYNLNVKNYWKPGDPYQGINVAAVAPTGQKFELQFHTAKSFKVKEAVLHPMYEEFRVAEDPSTRNTLWGKMVDAAATIPIPAGVESIPPLKTQSMG